ncbi:MULTISPECIES: ABC transporter substrate-binding protein [Thalassospira]|uniref:ABC transporter ATP-binding protein n=2 Tax=Thalassospira TaxID=168934 RepID=A0A367W5R9_9PROT|nr:MULTISPECIES: ABC transporter substrate-binding protein [Thalassospira]MDG4719371.1 ABC transporter substrate-binding protein [Thalassospira sp. FZY0004]RCK36794.1 ABC transporter ATP-binding protein [Thalassospira profundimaris]
MSRLKSMITATALGAMVLGTSSTAFAADKLVILLDWFVNPDHAPLIVAKEKGFFAKHDLDVELIEPSDPSAPPRLVAAGQGDVAVNYQPQLHVQAAQGLPLTRIGTLVATPLNSLIVLEDGPIKEIADLKGKKIGYSLAGFEDAILGTMLANHGVSMDDVELINVNFSLSPSLYSGQVDAIIGGYRNFELNQMEIEGKPGKAFYVEEEAVPPYDELIMTVRNDKVDDPRYARMLAALEEGVQYLINHPDDSWKAFIAAYPNLDDELNIKAWADTLPRFALRPAALDKARYNRFADYMVKQGLIKESPALETYATVIE